MNRQAFLHDYQNLIAMPSVSAIDPGLDLSNQPIINYLSNRFSDSGFRVQTQKVNAPNNKLNMLAQMGCGEGGLLLCGHSDTVPFDDGLWQSNPLGLIEKDNRLFGLGSCDMKGFFAFILAALEGIELSKLKKPLYVLATADEETTMVGARFFAEQKLIQPDLAIIGEPTELKPIYKHKGHIAQSVQIKGQAGHSSDPDKGVNAIEIMHQAIGQLLQLKNRLKQAQQDPDFAVGYSTLNLGHIHGGDGENRICSHCKMHFDLRPLPGLSEAEMVAQIDQVLAPVVANYPGRLSRSALYPGSPAFECSNTSNVIELVENLSGKTAVSANYATEAPFIQSLGCDTLVIGPGSIEQAHQANEFMHVDYIKPTVVLLQNLISRVCL